MAWYRFTGNNSLGHPIQGQYNADSELTLVSRLHAAGITSVSIRKINFFQVNWILLKRFASRLFPISKSSVSLFYYQLADMLEAGIPLKNALFVIANHLNNPRFIRIIHAITDDLARGASFSEALSKYKRLFSSVTVHLISLAHTKEELTAILRYCDKSMQRMTYINKLLFVVLPQLSITVVLFLGLLFLRFHYLADFYYAISIFRNPVPNVIHVFDVLTGLLTVHLLKTVVIIFCALIFCRIILSLFKTIRFLYHSVLFYFPIIGGIIVANERERLSLLYSVLLKDGASVQQCVQCSVTIINNLFFKRRVNAMSAAIHRGEVFSSALRYFHVFSAPEVQMIALGAVSNSLMKTFGRLYSIGQMILERKLLVLLEFVRLGLYICNVLLFFFVVFVTETLFFYPGAH